MNRRMNPRLVRLLLSLYPRAWRDRYGAEVVRLTEELIAAGETTPAGGALNLAAAAIAERGRDLADSRRTVVAMAVAALIAVAGSFYVAAHTRPAGPATAASAQSAPPGPARLTRVTCAVRPPTAVGAATVAAGRAQLKAEIRAGQCVVAAPELTRRMLIRPGW